MLKVTALLLILATQIAGSVSSNQVNVEASSYIVSTCIGNVPDCD